MKKLLKTLSTATLLSAALGASLAGVANASTLSVSEPRIVMSEKQKRAEFQIFNTADHVQSLKISLIDKVMNEKGEIKTVEFADSSAKDYLRVGPRVGKNINPKAFQSFRIRAKVNKMPIGEYRSHLLVESMEPPKEETDPGVHIKPNIKYSIPIIVRNGDLMADVSIDSVQVTQINGENGQDQTEVAFNLNRSGNRSVYGDFILYEVQAGQAIKLKTMPGQAVYTDIEKRRFKTLLNQPLSTGSELKIEFKEDPEFGGDSQTSHRIKV